jgi:hypothetical protein
MQAFLPKDTSLVEHVFDLSQLVRLLDAAGFIKLPPGSKVLGAEVYPSGHLIVGIDHKESNNVNNVPAFATFPLKLHHDFAGVIKLQEQIKRDAQEAERRLVQGLKAGGGVLQSIGQDFKDTVKRQTEDEAFCQKMHAQIQYEIDQANMQAAKSDTEATEGDIKDCVKTLYNLAHTFYAFVFASSSPVDQEEDLVVPFILGEPLERMLARYESIVETKHRDLSARLYRLYRGIIQRVYAEGRTATAETAKAYRRDKAVPVPFLDLEGATKVA